MADEPPKRPPRPCPVCGTPTGERDPEGRFRPFCSARCRQVDLGRWLAGDYVVPGEAVAEEEEG
ncbi:DNA gyrase inhibitor YacG [Siccirubricoccus sp. KC 17139]|uniref:DNA gyrase inhibitor YacG n=1 Tax=Siccirubricoccus soli TaxID=2899147 RepID=A0ABT1CYY1_9PROT|nr:DNA gyrase inhibitor YacG [Siccirubricoccus soli]MCO6414856.1 DNA gyrase inhibitor YacG [Siccirubricoccus soli]MCP2680986.1 DNA gyrase inhibitor YacG [Siccirubricoccus soli]